MKVNFGDNFGAEDATAATRDYVLELDEGRGAEGGAPVISVFGGKITTHRRLAEATLARLSPLFENERGLDGDRAVKRR